MRDGGRAALVGSGQYVEGVRLWSRLRLRVVIVEGGSLTPQHGESFAVVALVEGGSISPHMGTCRPWSCWSCGCRGTITKGPSWTFRSRWCWSGPARRVRARSWRLLGPVVVVRGRGQVIEVIEQ